MYIKEQGQTFTSTCLRETSREVNSLWRLILTNTGVNTLQQLHSDGHTLLLHLWLMYTPTPVEHLDR